MSRGAASGQGHEGTPRKLATPAPMVLREPQFLQESRQRRAAEQVVFPNVDGPWGGGAVPREPTPPPVVTPPRYAAPPEPPPPPAPPPPPPAPTVVPPAATAAYGVTSPPVEAAPPPPPPAPVVPAGPGPEEFAERIAAAVSALRLTSERLAEAARSDALELGLILARRIIEGEVSGNVDSLFSLVRSVVRRAGESRRVVVKLSPENAARVEAAGQMKTLSGIASAEVEITGDASLGVADCVVEAEFGTVDGRLESRFEELTRLLREAASEERG